MESSLAQINFLPQKDKTQAYLTLLSTTPPTPDNLSLFLDSILSDSLAQIVARQALAEYVKLLPTINVDRQVKKHVLSLSLSKMQSRVTSFEEQVCAVRELYADLLEEDEEYPEAAKVLIGIPLESGNRSTEYKLKVYIRIVRLFLEEEDSTSADTYFNRASLLSHTTNDIETKLQFKLCQARMSDYSRKFAEASRRYHELSYVSSLVEEERIHCLSSAITCAVLAPAGPTRSRILSSLYRDERSSSTDHHSILSKMFLDQIIRPSEVSLFASTLKPHQLAKLPSVAPIVLPFNSSPEEEVGKKSPETVLDRAVMEHNVLACSKVYNNISFKGLGLLLNLRPTAAEQMCRIMIHQGRLKASLDQIDELVIFDVNEKHGEGGGSNVVQAQEEEEEADQGGFATIRWDEQIRHSLQLAESVAVRCEGLLAMGASAVEVGA